MITAGTVPVRRRLMVSRIGSASASVMKMIAYLPPVSNSRSVVRACSLVAAG